MMMAGVLAAAMVLPGAAEKNPLEFPCRTEKVTVTFATAAEAERAELTIATLYGDKPLAFTTRWDDTNPAHLPRMEMFKRLGLNGTFFLNDTKDFFGEGKPGTKIKTLGGRFGNHTISHPYLMESGVNRIFREVVGEKLRVESATDQPCTSFVIPFGWSCSLEPSRARKLAKILLDAGMFVASDYPIPETETLPWQWMACHKFGANDSDPSEEVFERGLKGALAEHGKNPNYPKITLGTHSWCKPEGLAVYEKCLKEKILSRDDMWITDDAHYGAYRYTYYHTTVKKLGVEGKKAIFEVMRFDPAFLGELQPLTYLFGDAKPVKIETEGGYTADDLPEQIDLADGTTGASAKFPGVSLKVDVDEAKGVLSYAFRNRQTARNEFVSLIAYPAPMWSKGRIVISGNDAMNGIGMGTVALGERNLGTDYQSGDRYYAVQVDFVQNGRRQRLYAETTVKGDALDVGGTPRDATLVLGPLPMKDFDEEKWVRLSEPSTVLPHLGEKEGYHWRSMADKARVGFSAAAYIPWDGTVSREFKEALKAIPEKDPLFLAAVDFECEADGEKDLLIDASCRDAIPCYLNGERFEGNGPCRIRVKKGVNRLIVRWHWYNPGQPRALLLSVCDDRDVEKAVKFISPKTAPIQGEKDL